MPKLNLKDIRIEFPETFDKDFTNDEFVAWLEWVFEIRPSILQTNPLIDIQLSDCIINIGSATVDGEPVNIKQLPEKLIKQPL